MYKNILQEFCQKYKLNNPVYNTKRLDSPDHQPIFSSSIQLNKEIYGPYNGNTKKEAEQNVAKHVMEMFEKKKEQNKVKIKPEYILYILIDVENKPKIIDELDQYIDIKNSNIEIYLFMSKNYHNLKKIKEKYTNYKNVCISICNSIRNDSADILMIFEASTLAATFTEFDDTILVVTGDHFGQTLVEILIEQTNVISKLCLNIDDILEYISN